MGKPWACRFGRHKWGRRSTEDGRLFQQCVRCGKDDDQGRPTPLAGLS